MDVIRPDSPGAARVRERMRELEAQATEAGRQKKSNGVDSGLFELIRLADVERRPTRSLSFRSELLG